ncbi:MAG: hypothetical protein ABI577_11360 [bacterium]
MALSEALYPSLCILEVSFRNVLNAEVAGLRSDPEWLQHGTEFLAFNERKAIENASSTLQKQGKTRTQDNLVSELSFGFWTALLNKHYETSLWPRLLKSTFPGCPRIKRTRAVASRRFTEIRRLRNRISHHEPIWYWPLAQTHADVLDALRWLSPVSTAIASDMDRFPEVLARRP